MNEGMTELDYMVRIDSLKALARDLHDLCGRAQNGMDERLYRIWMEGLEQRMRYYGIEVKE